MIGLFNIHKSLLYLLAVFSGFEINNPRFIFRLLPGIARDVCFFYCDFQQVKALSGGLLPLLLYKQEY